MGFGSAIPSPLATNSLGSGSGGGRVGNGSSDLVRAEDPELDGVLNSALVLGLGERVADVQKRNARLLQEVDRIGRAAADKRQVRLFNVWVSNPYLGIILLQNSV